MKPVSCQQQHFYLSILCAQYSGDESYHGLDQMTGCLHATQTTTLLFMNMYNVRDSNTVVDANEPCG